MPELARQDGARPKDDEVQQEATNLLDAKGYLQGKLVPLGDRWVRVNRLVKDETTDFEKELEKFLEELAEFKEHGEAPRR